MNAHSPDSLDDRVVLMRQRDGLVLDWELHQTRCLLNDAFATLRGAAHAQRMEVPETPRRLHAWETSPEDYNSHMDERWRLLDCHLQDLRERFLAEREWWSENAATTPLPRLRQAVREVMAAAGGAAADEPTLTPAELAKTEDESVETRQLRWLLMVRAEIARRRLLVAEVYDVAREGKTRGIEWAEQRVDALERKIADAAYADDAVADKSTRELLDVVRAREAAAAASAYTGDHAAPRLLDLERIGAAIYEPVASASA
jgi:hypothetical protein